jgi:hypothetical protein
LVAVIGSCDGSANATVTATRRPSRADATTPDQVYPEVVVLDAKGSTDEDVVRLLLDEKPDGWAVSTWNPLPDKGELSVSARFDMLWGTYDPVPAQVDLADPEPLPSDVAEQVLSNC